MISRDGKHIGEFVIQNEQNAESSEECEDGSNTVYCVQDVNFIFGRVYSSGVHVLLFKVTPQDDNNNNNKSS
jgi:hypothetical protein